MSQDVRFGGWLKQRRTELGITRDELSERLGFSLDLLRKLESEQRRPSGQIAHLLADYFRIPADEHEAFVTFARTGGAATLSSQAASGAHSASPTAPWRRAYVHQTNLPAVLTPLIGREEEASAARDQILHPRARLLTLTGPPGTGKTRLALQVASDLVDHFEDGVYFVDLSPVLDPDLVLSTAARALGLKESRDRTLADALMEYVREKRMLMLLDNFEQVLDAAPDVVRLLQAGPWLKALVTSREPLHVRGERRYLIPPLAVPDLARLPPVDTLHTFPSVELFVERAQEVAVEFSLEQGNAEDVAAVCVGLEGLPLAIELAAARADFLSPREIRAGLDNRLKLLALGARDLPPRQRTLRSAIEWSYDLLGREEQLFFNRLGVFAGGFTSQAVEAISSPLAEQASSRSSVLDALASLVDKSLVKQDRLAGQEGEARFGMLEAIREFAFEKLHEGGQPAEVEEIERRHAHYFLSLVEEAEPHLPGAEQVKWLERLEHEYENIRAALRWTRAGGRVPGVARDGVGERVVERASVGLRIAGALPRFWYKRGYMSEGREQLASTLASSPQLDELRAARSQALISAGILAHLHGDYASARSSYEECLAIRRELGDKPGIAEALSQLGMLFDEQADNSSGRPLYEEALAVRREIGDPAGVASSLLHLGVWCWEQGDNVSARAFLEESLAIRRKLGDKRGIAFALGNLGTLAEEAEDYLAARSLFEEALAIWREFGDQPMMSHAIANLASLAYDEGAYASALSLYQESLTIRWKARSTIHVLNDLVGLGRLAARTGDATRAARLLGVADALWEGMGVSPEPAYRKQYEEGEESARAQLSDDAFTQAWADGHAMSIEEAVDYALQAWRISMRLRYDPEARNSLCSAKKMR